MRITCRFSGDFNYLCTLFRKIISFLIDNEIETSEYVENTYGASRRISLKNSGTDPWLDPKSGYKNSIRANIRKKKFTQKNYFYMEKVKIFLTKKFFLGLGEGGEDYSPTQSPPPTTPPPHLYLKELNKINVVQVFSILSHFIVQLYGRLRKILFLFRNGD